MQINEMSSEVKICFMQGSKFELDSAFTEWTIKYPNNLIIAIDSHVIAGSITLTLIIFYKEGS